jgi:hypothetical protein
MERQTGRQTDMQKLICAFRCLCEHAYYKGIREGEIQKKCAVIHGFVVRLTTMYTHTYTLKEEALDRSLWRTRFRRGYGRVVRLRNESVNE